MVCRRGVDVGHLPKPPPMTTSVGEPSSLLTSINLQPHTESFSLKYFDNPSTARIRAVFHFPNLHGPGLCGTVSMLNLDRKKTPLEEKKCEMLVPW